MLKCLQRLAPGQLMAMLLRPWLLLLGLVLVALNLRPALSSMAPLLGEVSDKLGLSAAQLQGTAHGQAW